MRVDLGTVCPPAVRVACAQEPLVDFDAQPTQLKLQAHVDVLAALLSHEGATLVSIRTNSGCRIKILPPAPADPMNRLLHMGGTQEAVCAALGYVLAEMQKSCGTNPAVQTAAGFTVRIMIRNDACGSIIGKGGAVIAQIRQQSGCVVKMDQARAPVAPSTAKSSRRLPTLAAAGRLCPPVAWDSA